MESVLEERRREEVAMCGSKIETLENGTGKSYCMKQGSERVKRYKS